MFPSDEQFGQWRVSQLGKDDVKADDRLAAMWAAEDLEFGQWVQSNLDQTDHYRQLVG